MALRNVVLDGDPVLRKNCRPVTEYNERLGVLLDDMAETMLAQDGLGLAAPQVGVMRRLFVALEESAPPREQGQEEEPGEETEEEGREAAESREEDGKKPVILEFINPEVIEREGEVRGYEGCLSFPGQYAAIARPQRVKVRAFGRDGRPFEYEATGITARCLCHETDHLNGVTIDDLAEYFFDPKVPHDLDETMGAGREEEPEEDGPQESGERGEAEQPAEGDA